MNKYTQNIDLEFVKKGIEEGVAINHQEMSGSNYLSPVQSDMGREAIIFTSSDRDKAGVELICKYLDEFTDVSARNGFDLEIKCGFGRETTVRLVQATDFFDPRKVFEDVDNLLKTKKAQECSQSDQNQVLTKEMSKIQASLERKLNSFMNSQVKMVQHLEDEMISMRDKLLGVKKTKKSFYDFSNLEVIWQCPHILQTMCLRLSKRGQFDHEDVEPPLADVDQIEDKQNELIAYFNLLQTEMNSTTIFGDLSHGLLKEWFKYNWTLFCYEPDEWEKREKTKEMNDKFKLKNTVGTIHFLPVVLENCDPYYFIFAIMNKKIVCWAGKTSKVDAIEFLYSVLKPNSTWSTNCKFATDFTVKRIFSDLFVHSTNTAVYEDNERVITWMKNNFGFLQSPCDPSFFGAVPAIYKMFIDYCHVACL